MFSPDQFFDAVDCEFSQDPPESSPSTSAPGDPCTPDTAAATLRRRRSRFNDSAAADNARWQPCEESSISTITQETPTGDESTSPEASRPPPLISIVDLVIKSVFFQINLVIYLLKMPVTLITFTLSLATNPLGALKKGLAIGTPTLLLDKLCPILSQRIGGLQGIGKLAARIAWGFFWSFYVGFLLVGLLVLAFLGGRTVFRRFVDAPVQSTHELSLDYTKECPDAVVPLGSLVPPNHNLQLIILLTMPESDYNRRLGMFQMRAEFLSASGKVIYSSSKPCMLRFKSPYMRVLETLLKSGTLLTGYSTESQTLEIKMMGLINETDPPIYVRVILNQRAEYKPSAGIPEIYAMTLKIESELPLLKRILWKWRWTVFIWISMGIYTFELMIVLVCCRPIIIPRFGIQGG